MSYKVNSSEKDNFSLEDSEAKNVSMVITRILIIEIELSALRRFFLRRGINYHIFFIMKLTLIVLKIVFNLTSLIKLLKA